MNGGAALTGHIYQQNFVAFSLLSSEASRLLIDNGPSIRAFAIEGRTTDTGPAWDVRFERENDTVELLECKDTAITRDDRITFYRRVRREIAAGTSHEVLSVGWVTDPTKQGGILDHLEQMSALAKSAPDVDWSDGKDVRVSSGESALKEALYYLCASNADGGSPPSDVNVARGLLSSRLQVHRHIHCDLSESVKLLVAGLFEGGAGEAIHKYIIGDLSTRIVNDGLVSYQREAFLTAIGTAPLALSAAGAFRDILEFQSAAGRRTEVPRIIWQCLPQQPTKTWPLTERLPGLAADTSTVITADTGVGKTATSWQLFDARKEDHEAHHILRFDAGDLEDNDVRSLPRFLCILCGVARTWIVIDGLDEITPSSVTRWRQTVNRLLGLPRCTVIITVRTEVLSAHDWMQQLTDPLSHATLPRLSIEQVADAFHDADMPVPESEALLQCLRNSFLLSLYARMATPTDLPLRTSGEVTGFHVIEVYWKRRVVAESQGLRGGMAGNATSHHKRRAVAYLQARMLNGDQVVSRAEEDADEASGIDTLLREGVLSSHSINSVRWSHDWLHQYALIDNLVQNTYAPSPERLAEIIVGIAVDHVRRTACVAATKWIINRAEWGPVSRFLTSLYGRCPQLPSEALPVLVESSHEAVALAELPVDLVIEFIEVAIQLHAVHWANAVSALPEQLFDGPSGPALLDAVTRFDEKVVLSE